MNDKNKNSDNNKNKNEKDIAHNNKTSSDNEELLYQVEGEEQNNDDNKLEIKEKKVKVAISKEKSRLIAIAAGVAVLFIVYKAFQPNEEELKQIAPKSEISNNLETKEPPQEVDKTQIEPQVPALPDTPELISPAPPPPPQIPSLPDVEDFEAPDDNNSNLVKLYNLTKENTPIINNGGISPEKLQRIKSSMTVLSGNINTEALDNANKPLELSKQRVRATKIGSLSSIIAEGRILDGILETAITTDLNSQIRGVISKNVYSESGNNVLIPKGSRLIGKYDSNIQFGQNRIAISWSRLIRPDGIDIALNSEGIDEIGRAGTRGILDNKYAEQFLHTGLYTLVNLSVAQYKDTLDRQNGVNQIEYEYIDNPSCQQSNNADNKDTNAKVCTAEEARIKVPKKDQNIQIETEFDKEFKKSGEEFGKLVKDQVQKQLNNIKPTVTIDQGTRIKIFVRNDLVFPESDIRIVK